MEAEKSIKISIKGYDNKVICLPDDLDSFFAAGIPVIRSGIHQDKPHEMDSYSLYLGLKAMERRFNCSFLSQKKKILEALLKSLDKSGGFWKHDHLPVKQSHGLRSTASAIKTLLEGYKDRLFEDREKIIELINRQIWYYEKIGKEQMWFLHDSIEATDENPAIRNISDSIAWNSSASNAFVLNTHLDTLNMLLKAVWELEINPEDSAYKKLFTAINQGIKSLKLVFPPYQHSSPEYYFFCKIDHYLRNFIFRFFPTNLNHWIVKKMINQYSIIRRKVKMKYPLLQFPDGYTDRDLKYLSKSFFYHLVNIYDAAVLAKRSQNLNFVNQNIKSGLIDLVQQGFTYALRPAYFNYWKQKTREGHCGICQYLEIFILTWQIGVPIIKRAVRKYIEIRNMIAPPPSVLGYDPDITETEIPDLYAIFSTEKVDIIPVKGCILLINHGNSDIELPSKLFEKYRLSDLENVPYKKTYLKSRSSLRLYEFS